MDSSERNVNRRQFLEQEALFAAGAATANSRMSGRSHSLSVISLIR